MYTKEEIYEFKKYLENYLHGMYTRAKNIDKELDNISDINKSAEILESFMIKFLNGFMNLDDLMNILNEEKKKNIYESSISLFDLGIFMGILIGAERDKTILEPALIIMAEEKLELQQKLKEFLDKKTKFDFPIFG